MSEHVRHLRFVLWFLLLVGALVIGIYVLRFWSEHGEADPRRYDKPTGSAGLVSYRKQIKPILESRGSASLSVLFDLIGCASAIIHVDASEIGLGSWAECAGIGRRA